MEGSQKSRNREESGETFRCKREEGVIHSGKGKPPLIKIRLPPFEAKAGRTSSLKSGSVLPNPYSSLPQPKTV
jgi:hypothetical protein